METTPSEVSRAVVPELTPAPPALTHPPSEDAAAAESRALFARLPEVRAEDLAETARQAVEHLSNDDYPAIALPTLLDPRTHGQVQSVLFADLLERPDAIALPALLQIARTPKHSFAPSALDDLRLLLGTDLGSDWEGWEQAVRARIKAGVK